MAAVAIPRSNNAKLRIAPIRKNISPPSVCFSEVRLNCQNQETIGIFLPNSILANSSFSRIISMIARIKSEVLWLKVVEAR